MNGPPVRPARQPGLLVGCLLALVTAVALLAGAEAFRPSGTVPAAPVSAGAVALAEQFYAAVDEVLRTGETAHLTDLVAPQYVEHPARVGSAAGREGLVQALLALRATAPGLRLTVEGVVASAGGDEVTVRLRTEGMGSGSFLGLALPPELGGWGWGPLEEVRIVAGAIAERWSGQGAGALLEPLAQATFPPAGPSESRLVALLRLTFPPHADLRISNGFATRLLVVESGSLTVTADEPTETAMDLPASRPALAGNPPVRLAAGEQLVTTPGATYVALNNDEVPAAVLVAVRYGVDWGTKPGWGTTPAGSATPGQAEIDEDAIWTDAALSEARPAGVAAQVLAMTVVQSSAPLPVALGRATLAPGTALTWPPANGTVLLAADGGLLALTTTTDEAQVSAPDGGGERWTSAERILATEGGAVLAPGTGGAWRALGAGPAAVLVLTLGTQPADATESPSESATPADRR